MFKHFLVALLFPLAMAAQAKELALIIGIDEYSELDDLNKALEDANGYRNLFHSHGFEVYFLENPSAGTLRYQLAQFYNLIEEGDTVVFVYSGHGWSDGALNYLIPADTPKIQNATIVADLTLPLKNGTNGILDRISQQGAGLTVAVIDACRSNPFSQGDTRTAGNQGGLAPIEAPSGTFIVYSAAAGQTALDRLGKSDTMQYSVFTRFFLPNLRDMGDLRDAIVITRTQVRAAASIIDHQQRPAYYDELTGTSCLFGDCNATMPVAAPALLLELPTTPADLAFAEAEKIIATQIRLGRGQTTGQELDFTDLPELTTLPPEIIQLTRLEKLDLSGTKISDVSILADLPRLEQLFLNNTLVESLPSLYTSFKKLEILEYDGTPLYSSANGSEAYFDMASRFYFGPDVEAEISNQINIIYAFPYYRSVLNHPDTTYHSIAAFRTGNLLFDGNGVTQNYSKAIDFYSLAIELGNSDAAIALGNMYYSGTGVEQHMGAAFVSYEKALQMGNVQGAVYIGSIYYNSEEFARAAPYFIQSVELGSIEAANTLGMMYYDGHGVDQDFANAAQYLEIGIPLNDATGINILAYLYFYGNGVQQNYQKALVLYKQAYALGDSVSGSSVAYFYRHGLGVAKDTQKAVMYYEQSLALGDSHAANELAYMYRFGDGIGQNIVKAVSYYEQGIALGNGSCANNLASMYRDGEGVTQNYAKAFDLFEQGAASENPASLVNLGYMYAIGEGIAQNDTLSAEYFYASLESGHNWLLVTDLYWFTEGLSVALETLLHTRGGYTVEYGHPLTASALAAMRDLCACE